MSIFNHIVYKLSARSLSNAFLLLLLNLCLAGCSQSNPSNITNFTDYVEPATLEALLARGELAQFYQAVSRGNLPSIRAHFEQRRNDGKIFNYGVLVNANIVTNENKAHFKPNIYAIDEFRNVPNDSRCYMNSALYNIANSMFFDDFLEIDRVFPQEWQQRKPENLHIAHAILKTLRETIYEIRLGLGTTPERIAAMRKRHIASLEGLNDITIIANFYRELIELYDFELVEFARINASGLREHKFEKLNIASLITSIHVKPVVENFIFAENGFGPLGRLSASLRSNQDIIYLDAIFMAIDPWGKSARYLAAALYDRAFSHRDLTLVETYQSSVTGHLIFEIQNRNRPYNLKLFHNAFSTSVTRVLRNPISKKVSGKLTVLQDITTDEPSFRMIAKSKHSSNHQIAEIFRYARSNWETHRFFGPAQFAILPSNKNDGTYEDFLYYFENQNGQ